MKEAKLQPSCLYHLLPRLEGCASSARCVSRRTEEQQQTLHGANMLMATSLRNPHSWRNFSNCWIKYCSVAIRHVACYNLQLNWINVHVQALSILTEMIPFFFFFLLTEQLRGTVQQRAFVCISVSACASTDVHTHAHPHKEVIGCLCVYTCLCMDVAFILTYLIFFQDCEFPSSYLWLVGW